jgi:hypothetical protein
MPGRSLVFLIAAALAVALYPLLNEQTWGPCAAVEQRFLGLVVADGNADDVLSGATAQDTLGVGDGKLAEAVASQRKPGLAAFATCYGYYWRSIYDRKWLRRFGYLHFSQ